MITDTATPAPPTLIRPAAPAKRPGQTTLTRLRNGPALWGEVPNRLKLRWLKTVVVSVEEKAHVMRQVGIGKASVSEPLLTCRNK
jgi:hypothetical protein